MKIPEEQSCAEWLNDYEGISQPDKLISSQVADLRPKTDQDELRKSVKAAGITLIRNVADDLVINTKSYISDKLNARILNKLNQLASIAETDTGESLYEYIEYRTIYSNKREYLVLVFKEIHTGEIAERFFNIKLRNSKGKNFKTGINGEFRIKGSIKRPIKGSFIKFWIDTMNVIPYGRLSHIHRHMNSKLSGAVISCPNPQPHHDGIKLKSWKYEGRLYKAT